MLLILFKVPLVGMHLATDSLAVQVLLLLQARAGRSINTSSDTGQNSANTSSSRQQLT